MQITTIEQIVLIDPREVSNCLNDEYFGLGEETRRKVFERSIEVFGIVLPVIATPNATGKFTIVDGYKRWRYALEHQKPLPALIKNLSGDEAATLNIALNFARESVDIKKLSKMAKKVSYPGALRDLGFTSKEIVSLTQGDEEILEKSRDMKIDVSMSIASTSIVDNQTAKNMLTLAKRFEAKTKEDVERLKNKAKEMKFGVHCALCGKLLQDEEKLWLPVCSTDKFLLLEELKNQLYDKQLKDWLTGEKCYREEIITVSKQNLLNLLKTIPEQCRNEEITKVIMRLENEVGSLQQ